jgi:uncharacterized membrane protein
MWANMLFLFTVVVLPFSTGVLGRYLLDAPALALYGVNLAACTATLSARGVLSSARALPAPLRTLIGAILYCAWPCSL